MRSLKSDLFPILLNFIVTFGRFFSFPFLTLLLEHNGMPLREIGLVIGTPAFVSLVFSPVGSYIISRFSTKTILSLSFFSMSIGYWGYGTYSSLFALLMCASLCGIGIALYNPIILTIISANTTNVDQAMSTNYWMTNIAGAAGPLIGAFFGGGKSSAPFLIYSGLLLVLQAPILFGSYKMVSDSQERESVSGFFKKHFLRIFFNTTFLSVSVLYLLLFIMETQYDSAFGIIIKQKTELGATYLAYMLTTMTITVLVLQPIIILLDRYLSSKIQLIFGWLIYMVGIIVIGFGNVVSLIYVLIIGFLFGTGESLIGPKIQVLIGKSVSVAERPIAFSVSTSFGNLGYFLGPTIGLNVLSISPDAYGVFLSSIGILIGLLVIGPLRKVDNLV